MKVEELLRILDDELQANQWLESLGFSELDRARSNLDAISKSRMTTDQVSNLLVQFQESIIDISDPDMALNNLERFISAARSPLSLGAMFERDPTALPILMRIFSASQHFSDLLIRDTEAYDSLRLSEGQLYSRELMAGELVGAIANAVEPMQAMQIIRRFKHRETLRIAFGDLVVGHLFDQVVEQISFLADSVVEAALYFAHKSLVQKWGEPLGSNGERSKFVVFALGKLGGRELNYSSDIDLICVYENDGKTDGKGKSNLDFFQKLTRDLVKLINEPTTLGAAYRVDLRLRPEGSRGPICCSSRSFLQYYDLKGRNWERQAFLKARPVAGDLEFGSGLIDRLRPWVYRPILNRVDIGEIKALKRKIEHRALVAGEERTNVKTGHGGIRDIEFTIQFLQLLNGGSIKSVRTVNTLKAIRKLSEADCLNRQEAELLTQNYCWLRKLEHFLQIMFDLQTHTLPEDESELAKIALRMGYRADSGSVFEQFQKDLYEVTNVNRQILNHILHNAFQTNGDNDSGAGAFNEVDLVLQTDLTDEQVAEILTEFKIVDAKNARRLIESLAVESTMFLSTHRCRHFLAAVITPLLDKISTTPEPDSTLVSLSAVAEAIGGKGALWELFNFNPPSLDLFVRLCASGDYLVSIVRRNPGIIDELIDSLLMDRLPKLEWLKRNLNELTAGTTEPSLILHSFKNLHHLRVGARDIVGKDSIQETHRSLSDIAEVCLEAAIDFEFGKASAKHSKLDVPHENALQRNGLVLLAMGKLGGREPNYHSDLDVVFLFDSSGSKNDWLATTPQHFYSELAGRISKFITTGPHGKLFDLDSRLRPSGRSGVLAVSMPEFKRYFESGEGQLWERLALCKARTIFGSPVLRSVADRLVREVIFGANWRDELLSEIYAMRMRMQQNCHSSNIKRGAGGTVDVEFIVQTLQLKFAEQHPNVLVTGTTEAIEQLKKINALPLASADFLIASYQFLRGVESRLRLMNTTARHDLPAGPGLMKLAYLMRLSPDDLTDKVASFRAQNRAFLEEFFGHNKSEPA